jgi:hypothetical protein
LDNVTQLGCRSSSDVVPWSPTLLTAVPDSPIESSRKLLIQILACEKPSRGWTLQQLGPYFSKVPSRLGCNPALDAVTGCLTASYARRYLPHLVPKIRASCEFIAYGEAIQALRNAVQDVYVQECENTLCASLSLFLYEFFLQKPSLHCITLAGGVSSIFKAWGPSRITSDFALSLFDSHYKTMISHAMLFGKDCFLGEAGWVDVFTKCPSVEADDRELWPALARICNFLQTVRQVQARDCYRCTDVVAEGRRLRKTALLLESSISKRLSRPEVFEVAPELYSGPPPNVEGGAICTKHTHELIEVVVYARSAVLMVDGALQRLGETDAAMLSEQCSLTEWLCATMPVAFRLGAGKGSYNTVSGAAAFGLSSERQRKLIATYCACLIGKGARPEDLTHEQFLSSYRGLCNMNDVMTGGRVSGLPWNRNG